jgi:hypothetical protein
MKIKDGVILNGLKMQMRKVLIEADRIWLKYDQELVVTSGLEGAHSPGSLHYYGFALDFRTRYFTQEQEAKVYQELSRSLDDRVYRVILHKTHIHVEFRGTIL